MFKITHCVDLSHPLSPSTPTYSHDVPFTTETIKTIQSDGYNDQTISMSMHIGTHIDAPCHFLPHGKTIADFPVEYFIKRGVLIDARNTPYIDASYLQNVEIRPDDIVLVWTGHDKTWNNPHYFKDHPIVSDDFIDILCAKKINIVGFDSPSPDRPPFEQHKKLLTRNILILENLTNLHLLEPHKNFTACAMPLYLSTAGSPVRAIAYIQKKDEPECEHSSPSF